MNKSDEITVHNRGEVLKYKIIVTAPISTELLKKYIDETLGEIEVPSLDGYATEDFVIQKINSINLSGYALKNDLNNYATKEELGDKADKTELNGLASKVWVEEKLSGYVPIAEE